MAIYTIGAHPVEDFDIWKSVFDKFSPLRKDCGELSAVASQHCDDPNMVTLINTWVSVDEFQAFFSREELKAVMGDAGVTAPPTIIVATEA